MSFYTIKAKKNNSAEIHIYGDIGDSWYGDTVTAKKFVKEIAALDVDNLTIRINSYGGSVSDGIAIYNAIKRHKATTTVCIDSIAASIASLIAMAGDTVEMADNALLMIHAPWTYASGNSADMREAADVLDKFAEAMSGSYADKTGKTTDAVMSWLTDGVDHWFTAAEALQENLIDKMTEALPVAATFDLSRYKSSMPAAAGLFNKPAHSGDNHMPNNPQAQEPAATNQPANHTDAEAIKAQVLASETQRRNDIRAKFRPWAHIERIQSLMNECLDDSNISPQAAGEKILAKLGEGMEPTAGRHATVVETGETDGEKFARGVTQAIMARCGKEKHDPQNEFRSYRLDDVARACLERAGVSAKHLSREQMVKSALMMGRQNIMAGSQTTSDFPVLLENVMHRQVLTAYAATPDTWSQFCAVGSVSDFREWQRLRVGSIGDIDQVNEAGEYTHKVIPDAGKEAISVKRRGNIIGITPEVIINDDIGYITSLTTTFGRAAKRTIETQVYALLASNPKLTDGKALFHSAHGNLAGSGAAPSVDTLEAARIAMATQKDIGGNEYLDIRPAIWLGPMSRGGDVRVIIGAQYDPDTADKLQKPNKVNGLVQNIVDTPRIAGNEWYLFADPTVAPVIEVVFLNGQSEPIVAMEENFNTAGISYRVELPFGVGAVGYEGAFKNPG